MAFLDQQVFLYGVEGGAELHKEDPSAVAWGIQVLKEEVQQTDHSILLAFLCRGSMFMVTSGQVHTLRCTLMLLCHLVLMRRHTPPPCVSPKCLVLLDLLIVKLNRIVRKTLVTL